MRFEDLKKTYISQINQLRKEVQEANEEAGRASRSLGAAIDKVKVET